MSVFDNREQFLATIPANIGTVTVVAVHRQNRPTELRKPYEYVLSIKKTNQLYAELRKQLKGGQGLQCCGVSKKAVSRGIRLDVFCLGFRKGLCGGPPSHSGVDRPCWETVCESIQKTLFKYLGRDAKIYAEPYCDDNKFQARFETYIMYSEFAK